MNSKKLITLALATFIVTSAILVVGTNNVLAQNKLNEADFKIKDFGIKDGKPWLTVEGKAGASKPTNASQIYAYAFVTDKGIFAVVSHGFNDSSEVTNNTQWHAHGVTLDSKNCVTKLDDNGKAEVNGEIKAANTNATKVDKVMTAILGLDNANGKVCVEKVFDSKP
jgi:hypothetical protein